MWRFTSFCVTERVVWYLTVTQDEVNAAVGRLRSLDPESAGIEAYGSATRLLPQLGQQETPAGIAALWILALGLYFASLANVKKERGVDAAFTWIEERYHQVVNDGDGEQAFEITTPLPQKLAQYSRALSQLPRAVVLSAFETILDALLPLIKDRE
jgi:hypothetical protein